jgi:DNA-binding GntR family transcriptional regulator
MPKPAEIVEEWVLDKIASGELRPGDHIAHLTLANKLRVSNNPVIQVLRKLEGRGILERTPDGACRVRSYSPHEVYSALAVRESIEGVAARFCAECATDEEMAILKVRFDKMIRAYHGGNYAPAEELAFHGGTVEFCHAPFLKHLYDTIMIIRQTFTLRIGGRSAEELIAIHEPIMAAIVRRDAAAAEAAARQHVLRSREEYWAHVSHERRA